MKINPTLSIHYSSKKNPFYVQGRFQNGNVYFLLDTGSDSTVIPKKFINERDQS